MDLVDGLELRSVVALDRTAALGLHVRQRARARQDGFYVILKSVLLFNLACEDPRDIVYGLLGVSPVVGLKGRFSVVRPDYLKPVVEVMVDALELCSQHTRQQSGLMVHENPVPYQLWARCNENFNIEDFITAIQRRIRDGKSISPRKSDIAIQDLQRAVKDLERFLPSR